MTGAPAAAPTPEVVVLVATVPRTGGTLLAEAMASTGKLGVPREWFSPEMAPRWSAEWGLTWPDLHGWPAYLAAAFRAGTTPNHVFSVKVQARDAAGLVDAFHIPVDPTDPNPRVMPADAALRMVHVRRRDKVRAALSEWRAFESGQWYLGADGTAATTAASPPHPVITRLHEHQHAWDRFWCGTRADGWEFIERYYEDVVLDLERTVEDIAAFVGVGPVEVHLATLPRRQTDPRVEEWIEAWVAATGGCAECGHPAP